MLIRALDLIAHFILTNAAIIATQCNQSDDFVCKCGVVARLVAFMLAGAFGFKTNNDGVFVCNGPKDRISFFRNDLCSAVSHLRDKLAGKTCVVMYSLGPLLGVAFGDHSCTAVLHENTVHVVQSYYPDHPPKYMRFPLDTFLDCLNTLGQRLDLHAYRQLCFGSSDEEISPGSDTKICLLLMTSGEKKPLASTVHIWELGINTIIGNALNALEGRDIRPIIHQALKP